MVKFCCFLIQLDRRQSHNHVIQPAYRLLGEADKWPHLICFYKISTYLVPNTSLLVEAKLSSPIMWNTLIAGSLENGRLGRDETQFPTPPARRLNGLSKTNRALIGDRNTRWARSKFDSYYKMFYLFNCTLWISFADEKRSSADNFIKLHREFPCEDAKLEYAKLQLNSSKRQYFWFLLLLRKQRFQVTWNVVSHTKNAIQSLCFAMGRKKILDSFHSHIPLLVFSQLSHLTAMGIPIHNLPRKHLAPHILIRL